MSLEVAVATRLGAFELDVGFAAPAGLTALFGRSGSGKTSIVNLIAGLLRPERGRIVADGVPLVDRERGIFVPVHRRRVGYIFQEGRLFPHLSVRQNLLYGRYFTAAGERRGSLDHIAGLLGIEGLLRRRPGDLSGGEKQRVAIGRALLASPRLLLMDEPLAALDAARKAEILPYIERLRDETGIPIVYVSHAIEEVARLATTLVLVSDGRIAATGPTADLLTRLDLRPLTGRYEAGAVLEARLRAHAAADGLSELETQAGMLLVPLQSLPTGTRLRVRIRARDVILATQRPNGISALNILEGNIVEMGEVAGGLVDVVIDCRGPRLLARITRRSQAALGLAPGRPVFAIVKTVALDRHSLASRGDARDGKRRG